MKKIWLIGKRGMLAQSLIEEMQKRQVDFVATGKEEVDITSKESLLSFANKGAWSHIINCAAYTQVDLAETEKEKAFALNVLGVEHLIAAAKASRAKLVHISSDYVFDGRKKKPYTEEDLPAPLSVYGQTKREGEIRIQNALSSFVMLRTSWLFGKGENHFVAKILSKMKATHELFVVEDQRGKMTFASDAASVVLDLLPCHGIFHFANAHETSWYEIASFIFESVQKFGLPSLCEKIHPISTIEYPTPAKRPLYSALDTEKVESLLKKRYPSWKEVLFSYLKTKSAE